VLIEAKFLKNRRVERRLCDSPARAGRSAKSSRAETGRQTLGSGRKQALTAHDVPAETPARVHATAHAASVPNRMVQGAVRGPPTRDRTGWKWRLPSERARPHVDRARIRGMFGDHRRRDPGGGCAAAQRSIRSLDGSRKPRNAAAQQRPLDQIFVQFSGIFRYTPCVTSLDVTMKTAITQLRSATLRWSLLQPSNPPKEIARRAEGLVERS
jgi:hypothetical protein